MSRRTKTTKCIVCHNFTIYANGEHPYGAHWDGRCSKCGANQSERAWIADFYQLPMDTKITLRCCMWDTKASKRCSGTHTTTLGDLLPLHWGVSGNGAGGYILAYSRFQTRCKQCGHFVCGYDLLRHCLAELQAFHDRLLYIYKPPIAYLNFPDDPKSVQGDRS